MSAVVTWILVDDKHPRFNTWKAYSNVKGGGTYTECFPKGVDPNLYASGASEDATHDIAGREESEKGFRAILQEHNEKVISHNNKYGVRDNSVPYGRGKKKGHVKAWIS